MAPKALPPAQFFIDLPFDVLALPRFITLEMGEEVIVVDSPTSWEYLWQDTSQTFAAPSVAMVWELFAATLPDIRRAPRGTSHIFVVREVPRDTITDSDEIRWHIRLTENSFVARARGFVPPRGFIPPQRGGKGDGKGKGNSKGKGKGKGAGKGPY